MKKNYWYLLAIAAAFVSMLTLAPHRVMAQNDSDEFDKTNDEEANAFRSDEETFDQDTFGAGDEEDNTPPAENNGGSGGTGDGGTTDGSDSPR